VVTGCACGHSSVAVPATREAALELCRGRRALEEQLERVVLDASRYLGVYRCRSCGGLWVQDCISSGQMDLFFVYPLRPLNV
jgi:hypothetical protein